MTPLVSVVIPTYRRPDLLERCLRAVAAQDLPPEQFEVVVADDEPSQQTRAVVEEIAARCEAPVLYVPVRGTHGAAAARNTGWRAAKSPVVAFTDDDTIPTPTWLSAGLAVMREGVAAVSGRVDVPLPARPTDYERSISNLATARFVTANCFYRRDVLEALGGFDERFPVAWREDSDLYFRAMDAGYACIDTAEPVVEHPVRAAPWGVSIREQRKSQYNPLLYREHPRRYREEMQPSPRLRYYAIVGSILLFVAGVTSRKRGLSALGAATWAAQTLAFAAKRLQGNSRSPSHVAEMVVTSAVIPPLSLYWRGRGALRYRVWFP